MALHYSLSEVSETGLKAAGVKSINLKENDEVINTEIIYPGSTLLIATQRGAMKKMDIDLFEEGKRAQRGLMLLKELKLNPHFVIGAYVLTADMQYVIYNENNKKMVSLKIYVKPIDIQMAALLLMTKCLEQFTHYV